MQQLQQLQLLHLVGIISLLDLYVYSSYRNVMDLDIQSPESSLRKFYYYVGCTEWSLQSNTDIAHSCLYITHAIDSKDTAVPIQACYKPIGLREVEVTRFRKTIGIWK